MVRFGIANNSRSPFFFKKHLLAEPRKMEDAVKHLSSFLLFRLGSSWFGCKLHAAGLGLGSISQALFVWSLKSGRGFCKILWCGREAYTARICLCRCSSKTCNTSRGWDGRCDDLSRTILLVDQAPLLFEMLCHGQPGTGLRTQNEERDQLSSHWFLYQFKSSFPRTAK